MYLALTGLNHKTAPVAVREAFSVDEEAAVRLLTRVKQAGATEAAVLSTCNRTEIYTVGPTQEAADRAARQALWALASERSSTMADSMLVGSHDDVLYQHYDRQAARHLFSVAAGLDSLILGEPQILGQVRDAYELAAASQSAGPVVSELFHRGIRAGKRVRTETRIAEGAASVSYAAVELAKRVFQSLKGKRVLLIGAGKMAELAAKNLVDQKVGTLLVANRTPQSAATLAQSVGGEAVSLDAVHTLLPTVDIVIASTGARTPILTRETVAYAMRLRKGEPLFMIDIAVPRDIEPAVHQIDGVFLYNIDDLKAVVDANLSQREASVDAAWRIVDEETLRFVKWLQGRLAAPVIRALREKVSATAEAEVERLLRRLDHLPEQEKAQVRALAHSIAGKLLHHPTVRLKTSVEEGTHGVVFRSISDLFDLDIGDSSPSSGRSFSGEGAT